MLSVTSLISAQSYGERVPFGTNPPALVAPVVGGVAAAIVATTADQPRAGMLQQVSAEMNTVIPYN